MFYVELTELLWCVCVIDSYFLKYSKAYGAKLFIVVAWLFQMQLYLRVWRPQTFSDIFLFLPKLTIYT